MARLVREPGVAPPGYNTFQLETTDNIYASRDPDKTKRLTPGQFAFNVTHAANNGCPLTVFEVLRKEQKYKVFFDYDAYHPIEKQPTAPALAALDRSNQECINKFLQQHDPTGTYEPSLHLHVAQRHRDVIHQGKQQHKVSFRYFVSGFVAQLSKLKAAMEAARDEGGTPLFPAASNFDLSVYPTKGDRLLNAILCAKGKDGDKTPLKPMPRADGQLPELHSFLVGYVQASDVQLFQDVTHAPGGFELRSAFTPHHVAQGGQAQTPSTMAHTPYTTLASPAGSMLGTPPPPGERAAHLEGIDEADLVVLAQSALRKHGIPASGYSLRHQRGHELYFKTGQRGRKCLHGEQHDSNNFVVRFSQSGTMQFRCFSSRCSKWESIGTWVEGKEKLPGALDRDLLSPGQMQVFDPHVLHNATEFVEGLQPQDKLHGVYNEFVIWYYNRFLYFIEGATPEVLQVTRDADGDIINATRRTVESSTKVFCNAGKGTFKMWLESPDRNSRQGYECKYYKRGQVEDPTRFNLAFMNVPCSKWGYDDFTEEELQSIEYMRFEELILHTIREQVCDGDETAYTYLMNWLAHNVQRMGEKMGTMVWLVGEQGTGKGWVFWTMGQLLGKAYVQLSTLEQLTAKFNAHLVGRALVLVDEACFNGSNAQADLIKNAVTERELLMESKFKDAEVITSTFNLCATSNHLQPVKVENQDRRHALFKTSSLTNRGPEYWVPRWEASSDPVMLRFLYRHLMNRDLRLWNPRAIPNTNLRAAAQCANRPFIAWFLEEAVVDGWSLRRQLQEEESVQVLRRSLYDAYNSFLDGLRTRFTVPEAERPKTMSALARMVQQTGVEMRESTATRATLGYGEHDILPTGAGTGATLSSYLMPSKTAIRAALEARNWWSAA